MGVIPLDPAGLGSLPDPPSADPPRLSHFTARFAVPTETARERRARRAVEGLLAAGIVFSVALSLANEAGDVPRTGGAAFSESATWRSIPIDLAHDPPWLLRLLPGVGPTRAAALVRDREANGPLPSVAALVRVPGFGEKTASTLAAAGAVASAIPSSREGAPP